MTLAQLRLEVKSRLNGSGYRFLSDARVDRFLSDARVDRFINQARAELDRMYLWPYREKSATGVAPLTISDLGDIEAVENTTQNYALSPLDWRSLLDTFGDLSTAGTPLYYYTATPTSPEVATYPVSSTDVIGVQYWRITADLSLDADEPAAPDDFHGLICDMATARAFRANRQFNEAEAYQHEIDREIQRMVQTYTPGLADYSGTYIATTAQDF